MEIKKFAAVATSLAMLAPAGLALADDDYSSRVHVHNSNRAVVINSTDADANTGDNWAGGAEGGNGGDAGWGVNVLTEDTGATGGNGGNGGTAGEGGTVDTGNASADAGTINAVNSNVTSVRGGGCGCDDDIDDVHVSRSVHNYNRALLVNRTDADADSGDNAASGAEGGNGGDAGTAVNVLTDDTSAKGGNAGNGGNAGAKSGGLVVTGRADSRAGTINVVNTNITRVRR